MTLIWDRELLSAGEGHISARIAGKGRTIVMLHSLLADSDSFEPLAELMVKDRRVVLFDLPGYHDSELVEGPLDAVADRVAAGIRSLELADKVDLLGNGYGGFVAQLVAARHPELIDRLVLADTGACFSDLGREAYRNMSRQARHHGLHAIADLAMQRLFGPQFEKKNPELVSRRKQRFLNMQPATLHAACAELADLDLRQKVQGIRSPALVLAGELDEATPVSMAQELAQLLPHAQMRTLPECAHLPQLQNPALFLNEVRTFLRL